MPGRVVVASAMALALGVALSGCAGADHEADPTVSPPSVTASASPTPVFSSDAEALKAATEAFKKFLSVADAIGRDGGAHPERIRALVTAEGYEYEVEEAKRFSDANAHGVGSTRVNNTKLQSVQQEGNKVVVRIYVCEDLREVDVVDASGNSIVDPSRSDFVAYVVEMEGTSAQNLVLSSSKYWSEGGVCEVP